MKKALFITSTFPPEESGGTIRISKLAKYLPMFGWHLSILTSMPAKTKSRVKDNFSSTMRVYRAPRFDITRSSVGLVNMVRKSIIVVKGWRALLVNEAAHTNRQQVFAETTNSSGRRLSEYLFIPDQWATWIPIAIFLGLWCIFKNRPSIIYSTSPSPSTLLIGYILSNVTGLPWVVEFRDPWMLNPFRKVRPFRWMESFETWLERIILCKATHIVVTSELYKLEILNRYSQIDRDSISYIPNGFDPEDFSGVTPHQFEKITIVHAGNFYGARSSTPFLRALRMAIDEIPLMKVNLQVLFIGQRDCASAQTIMELELGNIVEQKGVVSHRQSIEFMMGANILLLVPGPGNGTMPGKTFEYLAARKPILALTDDGAVNELITSTGTGEIIAPDDCVGISESIVRLFTLSNSPSGYAYPAACDSAEVLMQYDRKEIASKIARLLDALVKQ
jgi:glycosyltransferase involved in cell wall biosynthesis